MAISSTDAPSATMPGRDRAFPQPSTNAPSMIGAPAVAVSGMRNGTDVAPMRTEDRING